MVLVEKGFHGNERASRHGMRRSNDSLSFILFPDPILPRVPTWMRGKERGEGEN